LINLMFVLVWTRLSS